MNSLVPIAFLVFVFPPSMTVDAPPVDWGDSSRFTFNGLMSITPEQLKAHLAIDWQFQAAARLCTPLPKLLDAIEMSVATMYRHQGFHDVKVEARATSQAIGVEVFVTEGKRRVAGDIDILGSGPFDEQLLRAALRRPTKSPWDYRHPIFAHQKTLSNDTKKDLWISGKPLDAFDATIDAARTIVVRELFEQGFPDATVETRLEHQEDATYDLVVDVVDVGARATLGEIRFEGLHRHPPELLLNYLQLSRGIEITKPLLHRVHADLRNSGRFVSYSLELEPESAQLPVTSVDLKHPTSFRLICHLREYDQAPLLSERLSVEQEALRRLGQWIDNCPTDSLFKEGDVAIKAVWCYQGVTLFAELVMSDTANWILELRLEPWAHGRIHIPDISNWLASTIAIDHRHTKVESASSLCHVTVSWEKGELRLSNWDVGASLILPNIQLLDDFAVRLEPVMEGEEFKSKLSFGCCLSDDVGQIADHPMTLLTKCEPVCMLRCSYLDNTQVSVQGETLHVSTPHLQVEADRVTGRISTAQWIDVHPNQMVGFRIDNVAGLFRERREGLAKDSATLSVVKSNSLLDDAMWNVLLTAEHRGRLPGATRSWIEVARRMCQLSREGITAAAVTSKLESPIDFPMEATTSTTPGNADWGLIAAIYLLRHCDSQIPRGTWLWTILHEACLHRLNQCPALGNANLIDGSSEELRRLLHDPRSGPLAIAGVLYMSQFTPAPALELDLACATITDKYLDLERAARADIEAIVASHGLARNLLLALGEEAAKWDVAQAKEAVSIFPAPLQSVLSTFCERRRNQPNESADVAGVETLLGVWNRGGAKWVRARLEDVHNRVAKRFNDRRSCPMAESDERPFAGGLGLDFGSQAHRYLDAPKYPSTQPQSIEASIKAFDRNASDVATPPR